MDRNDNGVPITSIVLGIEPNGFDSSVASFTSNIGFNHAGLDLVEEDGSRTNIREGFGYYSGEDPATIPRRVSINERRRFVILNGQPGEDQWRVLYISNDFASRDTASVRSAIDSVVNTSEMVDPLPPVDQDTDGDGLTDRFEIVNGLDENDPVDALDDADNDGVTNLGEFLAGTDLRNLQSRLYITDIRAAGEDIGLRWASIAEAMYQVESTNDLASSQWTVLATVVADGVQSETILSRETGPFYRVRRVNDVSAE